MPGLHCILHQKVQSSQNAAWVLIPLENARKTNKLDLGLRRAGMSYGSPLYDS